MTSKPSASGPVLEVHTASVPAEEVHVLDLLILLLRRKRMIALATVGMAAVAAIIVLLIPSSYTAQTVILPPAQNSSMSSALLGQLGGSNALASMAGAGLGLKNPADLYVSLLRSRTVEDAMVKDFDLAARYRAKTASSARKAFESHVKVTVGAKDGLITIDVTDHDPNFAAKMANGYIDEYRHLSASLAITEAAQRRVFFQQQMLEANDKLAQAEEALKKTQQSTGLLQIDSQTRALIESAATLRAQVAAKQVQIQGMMAYATDDNPDVQEAKHQLAALQSQLAGLSGNEQGNSSGLILPKGNVPEAGLQYLRAVRDVKYYETISELLARQLEMAKVDEARQGTAVQVVDTAVPPDHRSFPKRTLMVLIAGFIGFLGACVWCFVSEGMQKLRTDPIEAQRIASFRQSLR